MKKFTEKKTVVVCNPDHDDSEIAITVTNDDRTIAEDDSYVLVKWFSEYSGRQKTELFDIEEDGMPTDNQIAECVRKSERGDAAYTKSHRTYVVTAHERVLALVDRDIRDIEVNPHGDDELVYDGESMAEAIAAVEEFARENPCEFEPGGKAGVLSYWKLDGVLFDDEDGGFEKAPELCRTTLEEGASKRLRRYAAAAIDEYYDGSDQDWD